jgi:prolipoprotein diacylglyceryl transferase
VRINIIKIGVAANAGTCDRRATIDYDRAVTWVSATIPAPGIRSIEVGPFDVRLYALSLLAAIAVATWITIRRWTARGGDADLVLEMALWSVASGLIGARLYHVITSWDQLGDEWYAPFAIWEGGLGVWGGVAAGVAAAAVVVHRRGESVFAMMDAAAPGVLIGQGIGRLGNYFNQELFGGPSSLPWALEVDPSRRPDDTPFAETYHPTFLYEMLWNFAGAAFLIILGRRVRITPPGLFCLYVAVYSLGRIFWEQLRVDPSQTFLGQRLNFYVALVLLIGAVICFIWSQRRESAEPEAADARDLSAPAAGGATAARLAAAKAPRKSAGTPPVTVPRTPGGRARPRRKKKR